MLALALVGVSFASAAQAAPHGIVAPAPGMLKTYLANAKGTDVKTSAAHNSQYYKFTQALKANPSNFRAIKLGRMAVDFGRTAYIPKVEIKGLTGNTAYIESGTVMGPKFVTKVHLPMF